jgi:predicted deacylase
MPPRRRKKDTVLVALAWGLNIIGLIAVGVVFAAYWLSRPASAAPQTENQPPLQPQINQVITATFPATFTPLPGVYYLPTVTRNPRSTSVVVETPTPFVLESGPRPTVIGHSVSGRPIEVYTFGNGPKQVMIVAGIHGGYEWNTIALADELIEHIAKNPDEIMPDTTVYILRNLNPDGDARDHGYDGRVNDHGVDLNRNFPTNWAATWDRDGCWNYGPSNGGTGPGSEPETQAMMNFLKTHKIKNLISYHSAALGVFPGGEPWEENSYRFAEALGKATGYPFPPVDLGCVFTGTLADYAVEMGATSVDMELASHTRTDFKLNLKALRILQTWEN